MIKNSLSKKIIIFIYLPLLLNSFFISQVKINMSYLIILVQIFIFISSIHQIKVKIYDRRVVVLTLFFLLFIVAFSSSLFSRLQIESLKSTILVFSTSIFLFLLVISDKEPHVTLKKIVNTQIFIGVLLSIIAIILFLFGSFATISGRTTQVIMVGPIKIYQIIMGHPPYYRVASLTTNPNTLGIILMLSQIGTLYLRKIRLIIKGRFLLLYLLQIIALILTQSRGAIITAFIMIIIFTILSSNNQINKIRTYIISILFLIIGIIVVSKSDNNVFSRFQSGLSDRNLPWELLINEIVKNPLIGLGFGVSGDVLLSDLDIKAHNIFLNSISEIGLMGFVIFISIWIIGLVFSYFGAKRNKENIKTKKTYAFAFAILFSLIFHQMIENKLLVYDYVMFVWVYFISISTLQINADDKI